MTTFLFWNLRGKHAKSWARRSTHLATSLGRLAVEHEVDLVVLVECRFTPGEVVEVLNAAGSGGFIHEPSLSSRVRIFARSPVAVAPQFDAAQDGRLTIRRVTTGAGTQVILAGLHFRSQMAWDDTEQALAAAGVGRAIADVEDALEHRRTVLVGDLNMDPFAPGVTAAQALNAVMTRDIARRGTRRVGGEEFRYFYNPMWGAFGDRTTGPPGTYYYSPPGPAGRYWHLFDQVLLRPALMDTLAELRILHTDGGDSLLTRRGRSLLTRRGRPRLSRYSDHLPLLFRLDV